MHKSVADIISMKKSRQKISVLTSYDFTLASLCDRAGIDILLVGDSAGMVMLGYENTIPVTMEQMCLFTEAVSRARENTLIVADLPFMSYQASITDAIENSGSLELCILLITLLSVAEDQCVPLLEFLLEQSR